VLSPVLFAVYIDDLAQLDLYDQCRYIVLYADDILLIAPSVSEVEKLMHICEGELDLLDMTAKKSGCMRTGQRYGANCANINSGTGQVISRVNDIRYLGIHVVRSRCFKCSFDEAEKFFYRATNIVFGKIGITASEEVTLHL